MSISNDDTVFEMTILPTEDRLDDLPQTKPLRRPAQLLDTRQMVSAHRNLGARPVMITFTLLRTGAKRQAGHAHECDSQRHTKPCRCQTKPAPHDGHSSKLGLNGE